MSSSLSSGSLRVPVFFPAAMSRKPIALVGIGAMAIGAGYARVADPCRVGNEATYWHAGDHATASALRSIANQLDVLFHSRVSDQSVKPGLFQPPRPGRGPRRDQALT